MKTALTLAACLLAAGSALYATPLSPAQPFVSTPAPAWLSVGNPSGTCTTYCSGPGGLTLVRWESTKSQCCSGTTNNCPTGDTPTAYSFLPFSGFAVFCGPAGGA